MRLLVLLSLTPLAFSAYLLHFPLLFVHGYYTVVEINGTSTYASVFSGDCFPYGLTGTIVSQNTIETISIGTIRTVNMTALTPEIYNSVTLTVSPSYVRGLLVNVFCINAKAVKYKMITEVTTITTTGILKDTITFNVTKTYLVPTVTTRVEANGITVYVKTYKTTTAVLLSTKVTTTKVSGVYVTTKTLLMSLSEENYGGMEIPANPWEGSVSVPTTITVYHEVFRFSIPIAIESITTSLDTLSQSIQTTIKGVPAPVLLAIIGIITLKRRRGLRATDK